MSRRTFIWIPIVVFILAGLVYLTLLRISPKEQAGEGAPSVSKEGETEIVPIPVVAEPAFRGDLVLSLTASGITRPVKETVVVARVSGDIIQFPIQEGAFVRKGDLLMKLDDREYRLDLQAARNRLMVAELEFGMILYGIQYAREDSISGRILSDSLEQAPGVVPRSEAPDSIWQVIYRDVTDILSGERRRDMMAQKSGLADAMVRFQRAELDLSRTEIRAPFSGYIADLKVRQGDHVQAGKECFRLVDLSQMDVALQVLESEIGRVRLGRKARLTFPAYPGEVFTGKVVAINPRVDEETRTVSVIVRIQNPQSKILPGMFATARIEAEILKDRLLVPRKAILVRDERKLVFIVREGKAVWCYVDTGRENEKYVEILGSAFNLQPGERVITEGHYTLVHDAPVRVVRPQR